MTKGKKDFHIRMIGSGNGMRKNPYLQKIFAQRFGMEIVLSTPSEEAACGTAIAASSVFSGYGWQKMIGI